MVTRHGLRYCLYDDPVFHSKVGEVHRDQVLATFAALNLPLNTPMSAGSRTFSINDLLSECEANFDINEKEPAWTATRKTDFRRASKNFTRRL